MKIYVDPKYSEVIGSNCSVIEIAESLENLKTLDLEGRYDLYSEIFREDWATNAGYILLPGLWENISEIKDAIDLEIAFVVGSLQKSALVDQQLGEYKEIVSPYLKKVNLEKIISIINCGERFHNNNLPKNQCDELVLSLNNFI